MPQPVEKEPTDKIARTTSTTKMSWALVGVLGLVVAMVLAAVGWGWADLSKFDQPGERVHKVAVFLGLLLSAAAYFARKTWPRVLRPVVGGTTGAVLSLVVMSAAYHGRSDEALERHQAEAFARWGAEAAQEAAPSPGKTAEPTGIPASARRAGVDPDCYGDGLTCSKARVGDAELLDEAVGGIVGAAGWAGCYSLSYVAGDGGEKDAIVVSLHGRRNGGAPACETAGEGDAASKSQLSEVGGKVKRALASWPALRANTDLLMVTNGWDGEVQIPLR